jgi:hypothetical protein
MIGQFIFFTLFFMTLFAGVFFYFSPKEQPYLNPIPTVMGNNEYDPAETEDSSTNEYQQLNVTTNKGMVEIRRQIDGITDVQKKLIETIDYDQQVLNKTNTEISDILKQVNGKTDIDALKMKALGLELQNEQQLLVARGQSLIAFNNQLTKNRKWLLEQGKVLNFNNEASFRLLQQNNDMLNDRSATFFDGITEKNDKLLQHTQDLMDEEHQKSQDQQDR